MALFKIRKKKKKSFTFSETALYLTAEINERGSLEEGPANMHLCSPGLSREPLFTLILGGFGRRACERTWESITHTPHLPVNNLERRCNKREGKVKRVWGRGGDVIITSS